MPFGDNPPLGSVNALMQQLRSQRLIKIFIGDDTEPYLMSETILVNASDYFAKALKHEQSLGKSTESGVLRFPEDGDFKSAWELLLCWLMTNQLPEEYTFQNDGDPEPEAVEPWARLWVLGDKYLLPQLQDAVMIEMLHYFVRPCLTNTEKDAEMVNRLLRMSPVNSPLRRLLAEETVKSIYDPKYCSRLRPEHLIDSDGTTGLSASLLTACHEFYKHDMVFPRYLEGCEAATNAWKEYLVWHLPVKHWLFDCMPQVAEEYEEEEYEIHARACRSLG